MRSAIEWALVVFMLTMFGVSIYLRGWTLGPLWAIGAFVAIMVWGRRAPP